MNWTTRRGSRWRCRKPRRLRQGRHSAQSRSAAFYALQRCHLERYIDGGWRTTQVELLSGVIKSQLADFNAVVTLGQGRQIEVAVFVRPTDPGASSARFHEAQSGARERPLLAKFARLPRPIQSAEFAAARVRLARQGEMEMREKEGEVTPRSQAGQSCFFARDQNSLTWRLGLKTSSFAITHFYDSRRARFSGRRRRHRT